MFIFEKRTQIPIRIKNKNPKLAAFVMSQYGGPDGELGASLRYLSQRFTMPDKRGIGLLTDIGTSAAEM
jgi:spore coat protein JC